MAQIVTITNPLTGQPAQVDQLDHTAQEIDDAIARSLPGGAIDIALQNNDPKNWGLGGNVVEAPVDSDGWADADLITETGFYRAFRNVPVAEWNYIIHVEYSAGTSMQIGFYGNDSIIAIRRKLNQVWQPWECMNPPMELGKEYRTTERYLGKPVYVRLINCGKITVTAPEVKKTEMIVDNIDIVISCTAADSTSYGWTFPSDMIGYNMTDTSTVSCSARCTVNAEGRGLLQILTAKTYTNNWTNNIVAMVKYIKSVN